MPNFLPTKGSRDVWSLYWEVRVPVTSPVWNCPGLYSLELGYQERFDNYSDFGSDGKAQVLHSLAANRFVADLARDL